MAAYTDGTFLCQFDGETGLFHQIGEVDQDRLHAMLLHKWDDQNKCVQIHWRKGMKVIHKYRNVVLDAYGDRREYKVYMFGWKEGDAYSIHYVLPNDQIIVSPDDNLSLTRYL